MRSFSLVDTQGQVVFRAPEQQFVYPHIGSLILFTDESNHSGVICIFYDVVSWVGQKSFVNIHSLEGSKHSLEGNQ